MSTEKYSGEIVVKHDAYYAKYVLDYFNRRLKLEDYRGNLSELLKDVYTEATKHKFEKIICKARQEDLYTFFEKGYMSEAVVRRYFNGSDAYFVTKYFTDNRRNSNKWVEEEDIITSITSNNQELYTPSIDTTFQIRKAIPEDAPRLAQLYSQVFQIYPTPLNNPNYIKQVMNEMTIFYVVEHKGEIVSAASAEVNAIYHNAELTDCATIDAYRKHGLMKFLLVSLEQELIGIGIFCAYSIARALSYGMNKSFYQLGYSYTGRLTNNCYIFDKIEDMNVWVKDLSEDFIIKNK